MKTRTVASALPLRPLSALMKTSCLLALLVSACVALPGQASAAGSRWNWDSVASAAQASPQRPADATQPASALAPADFTAGGWKLDNHWTYDEVLANKGMTTTVASVPEVAHVACAALVRIPRVGAFLAGFCTVHLQWARNVAGRALEQGRCFQWVIPGHQLGFTYPTTYAGDWCR